MAKCRCYEGRIYASFRGKPARVFKCGCRMGRLLDILVPVWDEFYAKHYAIIE